MTRSWLWIVVLFSVAAAGVARAQDTPPAKPEDKRPSGLPAGVDWKFNFDAGWGGFGFGGSLFTDPKEGVREDYGERWAEGFAKPSVTATYKLRNTSEAYGKLSVVGERTYATPPPLVGLVESSFLPEDLAVGWRSGKAFEHLGENALEFTVGRAPYTLGHGFLLWDGAAEGGSRGGYWSNARKAFGFAAIGRFKTGPHTAESFYLKKDDLPENQTGSRLWGANYEYRIGETSTFGATYMKWHATFDMKPLRDGLDVYNLRAFTAPIPGKKDLSFELEYAAERNRDLLHADAWTVQAAYEVSQAAWTPKFSYRYAFFQGDDPATSRSESFDPLFPGFYDWGYWWQGEIGGEYFLGNSNLKSHLVRAHVAPTKKVGGGVMFYKFLLDVPATYGPKVTDPNLAFEVDGYTDWKINRNFTASFVAAFANPQKAVEQNINRTANFRYGMVFLAYSY
jgi:hypothetical protein